MSEKAPRGGLTRRNTGYPATPYHGWWWTTAAVRNFEKMSDQRNSPAEIDASSLQRPRKCSRCGTTTTTGNSDRRYVCSSCRTGKRRSIVVPG